MGDICFTRSLLLFFVCRCEKLYSTNQNQKNQNQKMSDPSSNLTIKNNEVQIIDLFLNSLNEPQVHPTSELNRSKLQIDLLCNSADMSCQDTKLGISDPSLNSTIENNEGQLIDLFFNSLNEIRLHPTFELNQSELQIDLFCDSADMTCQDTKLGKIFEANQVEVVTGDIRTEILARTFTVASTA